MTVVCGGNRQFRFYYYATDVGSTGNWMLEVLKRTPRYCIMFTGGSLRHIVSLVVVKWH